MMNSHKKLSMKKRNTALFRNVFRSRTSFASCALSASIGYKYLSINLRQNCASTESRRRTGPVPRSRSLTQYGLTRSSLTTPLSALLRDAGITYNKRSTGCIAGSQIFPRGDPSPPHLKHGFLGPPESTDRTVLDWLSVQPLLMDSQL